MIPLFLRIYKTMARTLFGVALLMALLPVTLLAQFCRDGTTVATDKGTIDYPFGPGEVVKDSQGNLYVSDPVNNRILKFLPGTSDGVVFAGGNGAGDALNQLYQPSGILLDGNGNVLVADNYNRRVLKFPPNSTSATMGTAVAGGDYFSSQLGGPADIVLDDEGNLYVSCIEMVLKFPPNSTSATVGTIVAGGSYGTDLNQFQVTAGIAIDPQGNLYVGDFFNNRVLMFPPNSTSATLGTIVAGGNGYGSDINQVKPIGIVVDGHGNLLVSDVTNHRVQLFPPGSTSATAGITLTGGNGPETFPNGLYIDADGYLYLCEGGNSRVQRFAPGSPLPALNLPPAVSQPIFQNTPLLTLTVSGCDGGTVTWQGPNGTSGTGTTISVPTSATGTLAYSATCTVGNLCPSLPRSTTVTISPPDVTGSFDGFVYGADCATFRGWAWDRTKPNAPVSVDILDGAKFVTSVLADAFRTDLQTAGKGNGKHAFSFPVPNNLKDGKPHNLSARVSGSSFILKDSPKSLICVGTGTPENKPPVPPTPTILVAPIEAKVNVPFSATLVAFTDPEGQPLTYKLTGLPGGLVINETTRVISGTPTEAGIFVLAYSATDPGPLTNSVSFALTVNPASTTTVTGSFEGYLDKVECGTIRGWVWDRNKPNTPVTVEFYTGGTVWGSVVANIYRDDLKNAGKGNGAHAYSFEVPLGLKDGQPHSIRARVSGSTYDLKDSGKALTCSSPIRLSAETGSALKVTVLGNPVSDQFIVEVRGAEGKTLQFNLTTTGGSVVHAFQVETAQAIERQSISVQGQPAGLLLLQVGTPTQNRTLKILKP